jgi:hypothetical protein
VRSQQLGIIGLADYAGLTVLRCVPLELTAHLEIAVQRCFGIVRVFPRQFSYAYLGFPEQSLLCMGHIDPELHLMVGVSHRAETTPSDAARRFDPVFCVWMTITSLSGRN